MRKVNLNMNENQKYEIIKRLVETDGNKERAAITLGCTRRHVNRMIARYKEQGKSCFVHGNRGKTPT
ncbi:Homeodomain-like domain-containing protein, partial [Dethiosulfatibacter aminovorans DSM 17477]